MYVFKVSSIIILLLFTILAFSSEDSFFALTTKKWSGATEYSINSHIVINEKIKEPRGVTLEVMSIVYANTDFLLKKDCLVYQVPEKGRDGVLKVMTIKLNEKCRSHLYSTPYTEYKNIYNFGLQVYKNYLVLNIDTLDLRYELFNLKTKKQYGLNSNSASPLLIGGVQVAFDSSGEGTFLKNEDICFDMDKNCSTTVEDRCQFCPGAVLAVKANSCSSKYRKVCSNQVCGLRGTPACIKGEKGLDLGERYCMVDSPIAFCQKSFRVFCENGSLICR